MLGKLLPLIIGLAGTGAGVGTGMLLLESPNTTPPGSHEQPGPGGEETRSDGHGGVAVGNAYVKFANQFVVPIVEQDKVVSLVVLTLSLEVAPGTGEEVYAKEPKLRDGFLQVLFDHANMGGFGVSITDPEMLNVLRASLRDVAKNSVGDAVKQVLILDIVRQDV